MCYYCVISLFYFLFSFEEVGYISGMAGRGALEEVHVNFRSNLGKSEWCQYSVSLYCLHSVVLSQENRDTELMAELRFSVEIT